MSRSGMQGGRGGASGYHGAGGAGYHGAGGSGYHGAGYAGSGRSGYGTSAAARSPSMSHPGTGERSAGSFNQGNFNRNGMGSGNFSGNTVNAGNRNVNAAAFGGTAGGYRPSYANHGFYNGSWNGHYGGAYGYGGYRPLGWGAGAWGMGAAMYGSGYMGYSNPYVTGGGGGGGYNYSQPVPVDTSSQSAVAPDQTAAPDQTNASQTNPQSGGGTENAGSAPAAGITDDALNPAIDAFKGGDYANALDLTNQVIAATPTDAVAHEFRGLVLFAQKNYQEAAATIHSVLAIGPGWDWTTLTSFYSDISIYNQQLRDLELYIPAHEQDGAAHFLLGYHYLTCGHPDSAAIEFQRVVRLVPGDKLAVELHQMLSPAQAGAAPSPPSASPRPTASRPIDAAKLVGNWKATRPDGSTFALGLSADSTFTWKFTQNQKDQSFQGTYSVEGDLLVLTPGNAGPMIGKVTAGPRGFNFKMVGAPADDPGLNFTN